MAGPPEGVERRQREGTRSPSVLTGVVEHMKKGPQTGTLFLKLSFANILLEFREQPFGGTGGI